MRWVYAHLSSPQFFRIKRQLWNSGSGDGGGGVDDNTYFFWPWMVSAILDTIAPLGASLDQHFSRACNNEWKMNTWGNREIISYYIANLNFTFLHNNLFLLSKLLIWGVDGFEYSVWKSAVMIKLCTTWDKAWTYLPPPQDSTRLFRLFFVFFLFFLSLFLVATNPF